MAWLERARPTSERLVSVITPTRNRAETLERCIDSVLAQAHTEFELVVIDDGSEDGTPEPSPATAIRGFAPSGSITPESAPPATAGSSGRRDR